MSRLIFSSVILSACLLASVAEAVAPDDKPAPPTPA